MAAAAIFNFRIREVLLADGVQRAEMHYCSKFRWKGSNRCTDIVIFLIFEDGHRRHLGFRIGEILLANGAQRGQLHHCQNLSKIGRSVSEVLRLFRLCHHLWFLKLQNFTGWRGPGCWDASSFQISSKAQTIETVTKVFILRFLLKDRKHITSALNHCGDIAFFGFSRGLFAILDLFGANSDHPVLDSLYHCAKWLRLVQ